MKKIDISLAAILIALMLSMPVAADENRNLMSRSAFVQSAKIQYQHVYRKTKLRKDLYVSIDYIRDAIEKFDADPELYFMLGHFYAEINIIDTMVACFDTVEMLCADESLEDKVRKNCNKKDNYIKKIENLRQDNWEKAYNDGVEYLKQYDTVNTMMNLISDEDSLKVLDSLKALAYDLSERDFKSAIMVKPQEPLSYEGLGILYEREGMVQEAIDLFKKSIELTEETAENVSKIAFAYISIPDWVNSIIWFKKLVEFQPDNVGSLTNLSIAYASLDDNEKSYEYTLKVLEVDPENIQSLLNAGQYWFVKTQDINARMSEISDTTAEGKAQLAELEISRIETGEKVAGFFERTIELKPEDLQALRLLGVLYLVNQKYVKAAEIFEKYVVVDPGDAGILDYLGRAYINQAKYEEAIAPYEKIAEIDPGNLEAWERLEELYINTSKKDKAVEAKAKVEELKNL